MEAVSAAPGADVPFSLRFVRGAQAFGIIIAWVFLIPALLPALTLPDAPGAGRLPVALLQAVLLAYIAAPLAYWLSRDAARGALKQGRLQRAYLWAVLPLLVVVASSVVCGLVALLPHA